MMSFCSVWITHQVIIGEQIWARFCDESWLHYCVLLGKLG